MTNQTRHKVGAAVLTTIRSWKLGKSPNKGTKYIQVQFNHYISWKGWVTNKNMENLMRDLGTMGFKGANLSDLQYPNALDTESSFACTIESEREYQGKYYYDASWVNNPGLMGFDKKSEKMLGEFDMDTRGYIDGAKSLKPETSKEEEPEERMMDKDYDLTTDANFTTDDIPF